MMIKIKVIFGVFIISVTLLSAGQANALILNLTSSGASGFINSAYFIQTNEQPTGTGNIHSFVQIGDGNPNTGAVTEAYNTTVNNVLDNGSSDQFNHEVLLSEVPLVNISGIDYRQFLLDINEDKGHNDEFLSLDEIQVFLSGTPNQSVTSKTGGILNLTDRDLIYRMDANQDSYIKLDASLNSGSGSGDMFAYVPDSLFAGSSRPYVYLYSRFGEHFENNSGFEEWAHLSVKENPVVPEPASMFLLGSGLMGSLVFRRKKV